jgi:hypothetical protein
MMRLGVAGLALVVITTAGCDGLAVGSGQEQAFRAPRTPDGVPNISGIWQANNTANWDLEPHEARMGPVVALAAAFCIPGGLGVVDGDEIPYLPAALEQRTKKRADWSKLDPEIKCYLPGVPRATYMPYPFQVVQSAGQLLIAYEYAGAVRDIHLKDPGPAPVDSWMGQSVAKWDGDTLVVDVTGLNDQTWFDRAGNFHSDALHVVERYTRTSADVISYEATIEDPNVFTRPWKMSMPLYRRQERNAQLMDFKCVEFVEELMYGQLRKKPLN